MYATSEYLILQLIYHCFKVGKIFHKKSQLLMKFLISSQNGKMAANLKIFLLPFCLQSSIVDIYIY